MTRQELLACFFTEKECSNIKEYAEKYDKAFEAALDYFYKAVQIKHDIALSEDDSASLCMKLATVFILSIKQKAKEGLPIASFSHSDWKDIIDSTSFYGIHISNEAYSAFVFKIWMRAISEVNIVFSGRIDSRITDGIDSVVKDLQHVIDDFENSSLDEVSFVMESESLCMKAVIQILAGFLCTKTPEWSHELISSVGSLAFETVRYGYYLRERELLQELELSRSKLSTELDTQYKQFEKNVVKAKERMLILIQDSFSEDYDAAFAASIVLAEIAGVDEKEILKSQDDIDDYFS